MESQEENVYTVQVGSKTKMTEEEEEVEEEMEEDGERWGFIRKKEEMNGDEIEEQGGGKKGKRENGIAERGGRGEGRRAVGEGGVGGWVGGKEEKIREEIWEEQTGG